MTAIRQGTGEGMSRYLLEMSRRIGNQEVILEVIKDNVPAHALFKKLEFRETRELLVLRRPPNGDYETPDAQIGWLNSSTAIDLLGDYPGSLAWTNFM